MSDVLGGRSGTNVMEKVQEGGKWDSMSFSVTRPGVKGPRGVEEATMI